MGQLLVFLSSLGLFSFLDNRECKIVMIGLDAAGKTSIMYRLKLGETVKSVPTIGFNVETLVYRSLKLIMWDVGGQQRIIGLWSHYYRDTEAIVFVVDSSDIDRMREARKQLFVMLASADLKSVPVLIFANKQDLAAALPVPQVKEKLDLEKINDRPWKIIGSCAFTGEGLPSGLNWIADAISKRSRG